MNISSLNQQIMGPRLPMIYQSEAAECGMACLVMLANYFGKLISISELRQRYNVSMRGLNLSQLGQLASHLQLQPRPVTLSLDELQHLQLPAILHWDMDHYVVLKAIDRRGYHIYDPAIGRRKLAKAEISEHFTGVAIEVTPQASFEKYHSGSQQHWSIFRKAIPHLKATLFKVFVLSLILQGLVMLMPLYMQTVIDQVLASQNTSLLNILAIGFAVMLFLEILIAAVRRIMIIRFSSLLSLQMSSGLFSHLVDLPVSWFEKRHKADIISRFGSLKPIQQFFTVTIIEGILDVIMVVMSLAIMLHYDLTLAFVAITVLAVYILIKLFSIRPVRELQEQGIQFQAKETSHFIETIQAFQTIKLFNHGEQRQQQWLTRMVNTLNTKMRMGFFQLGISSAERLLFGVENILIIYLGAQLVMSQGLTIGMLMAFISYKSQFLAKSNLLIEKFVQYRMLVLHNDRISDITAAEPEVDKESCRPIPDASVDLRQISFRYSQQDDWVIKNFSCEIQAGEFVAITGHSGVGKSTLLKLLTGLVSPETGHVLIGGVDINHLSQQDIRQYVAVVLQDDQCLSGTIAQNICFFADRPDYKKIKACAALAGLSSVIETMPMSYDSLIGDMGTSLSGGQKQRLLIARALYREPKILVLDEASAHLDSQSEQELNNNLSLLNMTRIVIAHRQSTISACDRIINLDDQNQKLRNIGKKKPM